MRIVSGVAGLLGILAVIGAGSSQAQQVKNGGVTGRIVTKSVETSGPTQVYRTPNQGTFVLTTFCTDVASMELVGARLGFVARITSSIEDCKHFSPGIAFGKGEAISCDPTTTSPRRCMISGVLTKR